MFEIVVQNVKPFLKEKDIFWILKLFEEAEILNFSNNKLL